MERWSSKFGWRQRALAWDQHLAAIEAEAREKRAREKAELWARRHEEQREADYQLRQSVTQRTTQLLGAPLIERIVDARQNDNAPSQISADRRAFVSASRHLARPGSVS
jgi:hypothetical protein